MEQNKPAMMLLKAQQMANDSVDTITSALDSLGLDDEGREMFSDLDRITSLVREIEKIVVKWLGRAVYIDYLDRHTS